MPRMPSKKYRIPEAKRVHNKPKNWLKHQEDASIYHSTKWRKLREWYMMSNPVCVSCSHAAKYLDHITPISAGGPVWDISNLQGLCASCNGSKTAKQKSYIKKI